MSASFLEHLELALQDEYRIERELGGGGMSRVFLAEEIALRRPVVIKVLTPELAAGVNRERFRREIQTAAVLGSHPHIVPLLAAGESDGLLWFTMPWVDGESLRLRLKAGTMTVEQALPVLEEVASALAFAHKRGVVHRDIKPENVLLHEGHAMVADFGVAKALQAAAKQDSGITTGGLAVGTPTYMSPEQAAGDESVDGRADIYALGCVAYEMLSGTPPFTDPSAARMLVAHVSTPPTPLETRVPDAPRAVTQAIMTCLAKSPEDRFASADQLIAALQSTYRSGGSHLSTGSLTPLSAQRVRELSTPVRRRPLIAGLTAAAIAVAGGSYLALHGGGSTRAAEASSAPRAVIVADVDNRTADSTLGDLLSEALRTELQQSKTVAPLAPTAIAEALTLMQRPVAGRLSAALAREIAVREGVSAVVEGRVQKVGNSYLLRAAIVSPGDGVERSVAQETAVVEDSIVPVIGRLARRMREALGESAGALAQLKPMEQVTTTSLAALRKYTEAIRAGDKAGAEQAQEIALLESAVALDSNFAMAWRRLGVRLSNKDLSNFLPDSSRTERVRTALTRAWTLRDRLSPVERGLADAAYFTYVTKDTRRAVDAYRAVLVEQPSNSIALNNLTNQYQAEGAWAPMAELAARMVAADSGSMPGWRYITFAWAGLGRDAEASAAIPVIRRHAKTSADSLEADGVVMNILAIDRQLAPMSALLASMVTRTSDPMTRDGMRTSLIRVLEEQGKFAAAQRERLKLDADMAGAGLPPAARFTVADTLLNAAVMRVEWLADSAPAVRRQLDSVLTSAGVEKWPLAQQLQLSGVYALTGQASRARALRNRLASSRVLASLGAGDSAFVLASLAMAEGRAAEASALVRNIKPDPTNNWPQPQRSYIAAHAERRLGNLEAAVAAYKRVVDDRDPRARAISFGLVPGALLQLCRLSDQLGNAADRRTYCSRIATQWKDADPMLQPTVAELRQLAAR